MANVIINAPQLISFYYYPGYNAAAYLEECINSAIQQNVADTELIIVDDGSTDQSLAIATGYVNDKVKVFTQSNQDAKCCTQ